MGSFGGIILGILFWGSFPREGGYAGARACEKYSVLKVQFSKPQFFDGA